MRNRDWAGIAAVILSAGVAVALPATLIIIAIQRSWSPADDEIIGIIGTLSAAVLGAVGGYVTRAREETRGDDDGEDPEPHGPREHAHATGQDTSPAGHRD